MWIIFILYEHIFEAFHSIFLMSFYQNDVGQTTTCDQYSV